MICRTLSRAAWGVANGLSAVPAFVSLPWGATWIGVAADPGTGSNTKAVRSPRQLRKQAIMEVIMNWNGFEKRKDSCE
jgi:hypothetical protein